MRPKAESTITLGVGVDELGKTYFVQSGVMSALGGEIVERAALARFSHCYFIVAIKFQYLP